MIRVGVLISGRGSNMEALARAIDGDRRFRVTFVASSRQDAAGLDIARRLGLTTAVLPYHRGTAAAETALERLMADTDTGLLAMAGFMRLLSPEFATRHAGRVLNIHPALLPRFKGGRAIDEFWETGERTTGVTVHLADGQMDHGPVLAQATIDRADDESRDQFEARLHQLEHRLYWPTLRDYGLRLFGEEETMKRRALISVSDKRGIVELAQGLVDRGWELISSSGTATALRQAGLTVNDVAELTGFPSILGGRVKTLHPAVFGGILARPDLATDRMDMKASAIEPIGLVVCNLYPFETTARQGASLDELIEQVDIGGVSLLRAAAKNFRHVAALCSPDQYDAALADLDGSGGAFSEAFRRRCALTAFDAAAHYDAVILDGLSRKMDEPENDAAPRALRVDEQLRYGENPYQLAALVLPSLDGRPFRLVSGTALSYNNMLDLDAAMRAFALLEGQPGAAVIKHTTPCGMAVGTTLEEAWEKAHSCDPLSAFGGVAAFTEPLTGPFAQKLVGHFLEVILCPAIDDEALDLFKTRRPKTRVLTWDGRRLFGRGLRSTWAGLLVQDDDLPPLPTLETGHWEGEPRPDRWDDLLLAWKAAALSKSNAVAIASDGATVGIGMGFCSRVFAVDFAARQASDRAKGAVLASDAFFPFPDGVERAAAAGVEVIIQPGGSVKDNEVFARAHALGVSTFVTGLRTFRH